MSIKLIAVDMDGTFLSDAKTYNRPRFLAQYQRMREQNIRFVVASGNQYYQLISLFPEIAHQIAFVAENGGWVVSGNEDVFNCQLPVHHFNAVVDHLQTLPNIEIIACGKRSAYTLNRYNDALKTVAAKYYHRLELVDDFNHLDDTILKFGLNVPDSLIPEIQPKLHATLGDMVTAVATGYGSIDLIIPGVHKANGLRILQQRWASRITRWWRSATAATISKCCSTPGLALPWPTPGKTSKPSPAIRRRITTKKVSCRLLIRCWIAKRRSPDKTRMRAHPG